MTGESQAMEFFARGADAETSRARAAHLRLLSMEERGEMALRLLTFAETMRRSTGQPPRRPLDRSLVSIMAASQAQL